MNTREKILRMIANTSIMYVYHIKENGLLHGKTGVMYYLYLYAQHSGDEICYDFAGELLDGLMNSTVNAPFSFEEGIAGLGWAVGRLLRSDIVGGTPNSVLATVDRLLVEAMKHGAWSDLWNELLYFAGRMGDNPADIGEILKTILSYLLWQARDKNAELSSSRKRAVRLYISKIKDFDIPHEIMGLCRQLESYVIGEGTSNAQQMSQDDNPVAGQIQSVISSSVWNLILNELMPSFGFSMDGLLEYVESRQKCFTPDELKLSGGLAGLGTLLLSHNL